MFAICEIIITDQYFCYEANIELLYSVIQYIPNTISTKWKIPNIFSYWRGQYQVTMILCGQYQVTMTLCGQYQVTMILCGQYQVTMILCDQYQVTMILCDQYQVTIIPCDQYQVTMILCGQYTPNATSTMRPYRIIATIYETNSTGEIKLPLRN